jgi:hypothetical protein
MNQLNPRVANADDPHHRGSSAFTGLDVCVEAGFTVRPGGQLVRFVDDVWRFGDVEGLSVQIPASSTRMDFTTIDDPRWRLVAKEYLLARLAPRNERVVLLPHAYRTPLTVWSCSYRLKALSRWLNWLTGQQVASLGELTQAHCDRYLAERSLRRDRAGTVIGTLDESVTRLAAAVIIELALYRDLFTADRYPQCFIPWAGRSSSEVAGMRLSKQNKTPLVDPDVLQPMLAAALYLTGTLGPHMRNLPHQIRQRQRYDAELREAAVSVGDVARTLRHHTDTGVPLEAMRDTDVDARLVQGWDPVDPLLRVSTRALARENGVSLLRPAVIATVRPLIEQCIAAVGVAKPWGRAAAQIPRADGTDTVGWTLPLDEREVRDLACFLNTASLLVTATVTGMRASELMELRVGCRHSTQHQPGMIRYRLSSTIRKGQPLGGTDDEWVVTEEVDQAVELAEHLTVSDSPDALLFGRFSFDPRYRTFREWVNGPAGQRLGLAPIPDGALNTRMLRRTLSHELAYRPSGLLAAKIALKHVTIATTEGYTARPGGAQAKLLAEITEHETERNLQLVLTEFRNYQAGILPAGPGARELIEFFDAVDGDLAEYTATAPNVIASDQHVLNLLTKRSQVLHLGVANYCWFTDPSQALCLKLAGTPTANKPLAGMCDSARCKQATHHPCHRPVWADALENTTVFLGSLGRTRKTEQARLQTELDRTKRVLAAIDAAASANDRNQ